MSFHTRVFLFMAAGVLVGLLIGAFAPAELSTGVTLKNEGDALAVVAIADFAKKKNPLKVGERYSELVVARGQKGEKILKLSSPKDFEAAVKASDLSDVLWLKSGKVYKPLSVKMTPESVRAKVIAPFSFLSFLFLALLKMLIVPIVFTSIIVGVSSLKSGSEFRRLSLKTFGYYVLTSLVAILVGQLLVNLIEPGTNAALGLAPIEQGGLAPDASFIDVIKRAVPTNIFDALTQNGAMLQIIFFAILFGVAASQTPKHGEKIIDLVESLFQVIMRLAEMILKLIPYGVFVLLVGVVASTGFSIFVPLLLYMATVVLALLVHACVTLPILLKAFTKGLSPLKWARAMSPALMTAFSTSSSGMTLPVTLETVQKRGGVSNRTSSFTLPLGATINMDGTALYEIIGVLFLAQYYASTSGFEVTFSQQITIVFMALLASIGAAGIPSAGLVMMLTILAALGLPFEGAALLLAVDRPLDMLRTTVNVWSDTCASAIIAASEGEKLELKLRDEPKNASD